jgi:hypothetical protein
MYRQAEKFLHLQKKDANYASFSKNMFVKWTAKFATVINY